jgi:hypothetical protein
LDAAFGSDFFAFRLNSFKVACQLFIISSRLESLVFHYFLKCEMTCLYFFSSLLVSFLSYVSFFLFANIHGKSYLNAKMTDDN